ncbi:hypothetical protein Q4F19_12565 [Sphingomonas sp. BIUV-7]|uniref:DUF1508 domain-containing protein n=1 Tax=Sphingomonas natans TaxID=3063330 RepID=A0ABT8YA50_9SPHN|nr:hypothetical protein [Sphingomonas sp. BIUV-7]MDO6415217.1 hypothetical protein [Sphingomonas sp. BIUV-7]
MAGFSFWLHMNDEYMWRWFCSDERGNMIAISAQSFFDLVDAERAVKTAKACMTPILQPA